MQVSLRDNLPFVAITVSHQGESTSLSEVLIDTGSARTILAADFVAAIGISPAPSDVLYSIRGVGGTEVVFSRKIDFIQVGERRLSDFVIEVGGMDYGFEIDGILGMDFLCQGKAVLDLAQLTIEFAA
jgi:predicted aspartyl protease